MHVAIELSTWVNPRGYGRFTRELTRALLRARSGHEITLVVDSGAAAAPDLPDAPRLFAPTSHSVVDAAAAAGARSPSDLWKMGAALSSRAFDAVLFPTVYSFVPLVSRAHVTVVIHDAMPETVPNLVLGSARARVLWRAKTWLACRRANVIATVSEASAAEIRRHLPVPRRTELIVLTEGADAVFTARGTAEDSANIARWIAPGEPYVLYVGGLSPHKRVPALIRAFGAVAARPAHHALKLILAGPGSLDSFRSDGTEIGAALDALGPMRSRVMRTDFVADAVLASLYRQASCVVLPSMVEGFGLPALEAMACGAPLLVARTPALEELCGNAAAYVESIDHLADRLAGLLTDTVTQQRLRSAGPLRAARFSWDEAARRWLAALPVRQRDGQRAAGR